MERICKNAKSPNGKRKKKTISFIVKLVRFYCRKCRNSNSSEFEDSVFGSELNMELDSLFSRDNTDSEVIRKDRDESAGKSVREDEDDSASEGVRKDKDDLVGESVREDEDDLASEGVRKDKDDSVGESVREDEDESADKILTGNRDESANKSAREDRNTLVSESLRKDRDESAGKSVGEDNNKSAGKSVREPGDDSASDDVREDRDQSGSDGILQKSDFSSQVSTLPNSAAVRKESKSTPRHYKTKRSMKRQTEILFQKFPSRSRHLYLHVPEYDELNEDYKNENNKFLEHDVVKSKDIIF